MSHTLSTIKDFISHLTSLIKEHGKSNVTYSILLTLLIVGILSLFELKINDIIHKQIQKYREGSVVEHRDNFAKSREFYAELKTYMRQQRADIGCEYMMLLEYHNGSENVVTNIQFCKFDITLEVQNPNSPYIGASDYINENIFKYDLLLSKKYTTNRINSLTIDELERIDRHFLRLVTNYNDNIRHIVFANVEYDGTPIGMLIFLFVSETDDISMIKITNCVSRIEREIQKGIKQNK